MSELTWTLETETTDADVNGLRDILRAANRAASGVVPNRQSFRVLLRDEAGTLVGGVDAETGFSCLNVNILALSPEWRNRGLGTELLARAEAEGMRRGCTFALLDTFDFQARPFYEKRGYVVVGTVEGYAGGHTQYFMRKTLSVANGNAEI